MEALVSQRQLAGDLPGDVGAQALNRFAVREAFQGLEDMTVAMTSEGTEGRPRSEGNRSSNSSSGDRSRRWVARKACTDPSRTKCPHNDDASSNRVSDALVPCMPAA